MPDSLHLILLEVLVGGLIICGIRAYIMIKELHVWHDLEDEEGVKVWYVRKSLVTAIEAISGVMDRIDRRDQQREKDDERRDKVLIALTAAVERLANRIPE